MYSKSASTNFCSESEQIDLEISLLIYRTEQAFLCCVTVRKIALNKKPISTTFNYNIRCPLLQKPH
jgi:hypothetical protein